MKALLRNMILAPIVAVLLVPISVTSVFAAGFVTASHIQHHDQGLESKWKREINTLQRYKYLNSQIPKWMSVWLRGHPTSSLSRARKNMYANEVHRALRQAEILVANHPGFDANGKVIDQIQAAQSVRTLATYLHIMRTVFIHKFDHHVRRYKH